jgi:hypothetical protein
MVSYPERLHAGPGRAFISNRLQILTEATYTPVMPFAHITPSRAQLAVARCTSARVSTVLFAARVCDLILARRRELIGDADDVPEYRRQLVHDIDRAMA